MNRLRYDFGLPTCRRPDITEGLKRLKCRTLIFVGDSSPFHSEAVHMTSKLDRRFSALVEVCGANKGKNYNVLRYDIPMN